MIVIWVLVACSGGHGEGTAVGNPGSTGSLDVVVTGVPEGVSLDVADADVDGVSLRGCQGDEAWVDVGVILDALPGTADGVPIDGGSWCGLELSFNMDGEPLFFEGSTTGGTVFHVAMDPGPIQLNRSFDVDGDALLLEIALDGTLDPATLEAGGEEVDLAADDPQSESWAGEIASRPALWQDADGDDAIGPADHELGDSGSTDMAYAESAGCGCGADLSPKPEWMLGLIALSLARRRRAVCKI